MITDSPMEYGENALAEGDAPFRSTEAVDGLESGDSVALKRTATATKGLVG